MKSLLDKYKVDQCACFNIRRTARAITQKFDDALQPVKLKSTQFSILSMLAKAGPLSISELAHNLTMDRTTVTRNLRPLEKSDYLRISQGKDKRVRLIKLSAKGQGKLKSALPYWDKAQTQFIRDMGEERFHHLLSELNQSI